LQPDIDPIATLTQTNGDTDSPNKKLKFAYL
jgi:hypothetical protein